MSDDRDIVERLEDTNYDGALFLRQEAAKDIRALRYYVARLEDELARAEIENARLREALEKIAALNVPRPVWTRHRANRKPSKYDLCPHVINMWDDCEHCIADYARAALAEKEEK